MFRLLRLPSSDIAVAFPPCSSFMLASSLYRIRQQKCELRRAKKHWKRREFSAHVVSGSTDELPSLKLFKAGRANDIEESKMEEVRIGWSINK